ncbi:LuxR C-terminal-related transcriptional regulator [Streptomyces sp. NPDC055607]
MVNRERELARAKVYVADPDVNCIVIQGDMGVGKSRLGTEILETAATMGHPTARALATAAAASIPLAAMAHLLPAGAPLDDPVALFRATAAAFRAAAPDVRVVGEGTAGRRLVLMVDDLHLLDETSITLLRQLLDANLLLLVASVRLNAGRTCNALAFQADSARTQWLHLDCFDEAGVEVYLRTMLGDQVSDATVIQFLRLSSGNALLLRELLIGALREGKLHQVSSMWQLDAAPASTPVLAEMIRRRLSTLSPASRELVETLACCEPLDLRALEETAARADCAELEAEGVLQVRQTGQRYVCTLAHPAYGEVIRAQIPQIRQRSIYRSQADWLKKNGARRRDDAMRIATFELAADGATATPTLLAATRLARHARDHTKVLELLGALPTTAVDFQVAFMRGEAHYQLAQFTEAEKALAQAQCLADGMEQFLTAVMMRTQNAFYGRCSLDASLKINAEAAQHVQAPVVRRILEANEAAFRLYSDPMSKVLALLQDAETIPVPQARHFALLQKSLALSFMGRSDEAVECAATAYAEHRQYAVEEGLRDHPSHTTVPAAWMTVAYVDGGCFDEARAVAKEAYEEALRTYSHQFQALHACQLGRCELVAGNLYEARTWYLEAVGSMRGLQQPMTAEQAWAGLVAVQAQLGATEQAAYAAARYEETMVANAERDVQLARTVGPVGQAWLRVAQGQPVEALRVLDAGIAHLRHTEQYANESWLLVEKARLGAAADVKDRLAELAAQEGGVLTRVRSEVASAMVAQQGDQLLDAARSCATAGLTLLAAETALAASHAYAHRSDRKGAARARHFSDLQRRRCGGASTPGLAQWPGTSPLTAREKEVALLAVKGMPSKEIAQHLVLSVRTVENFLQRVYNKTGITSRRELAEAMASMTD